MLDVTWALRAHSRRRRARLDRLDPQKTQLALLRALVRRARRTRFGRHHGFDGVADLDDFRARVPPRDYDAFWDAWWRDAFPRLADSTWPGPVPWLAVSSGTSRGATKFIPVTREAIRANARAGIDLLAHHAANRPRSRLLAGRVFMLGGSTGLAERAPGVCSGDLSGIAASRVPFWARPRYFPPRALEEIADWEVKIDRFARRSLTEDIRAVAGTPSWLLIFFDRLMEIAGVASGRVAEIWPDLEMLVHGGVAWEPYRDRFAALLEGGHAETREVYPASEGFFAIADRGDGDGLRLLIDNGVFYEFMPVSELDSDNPSARWVGDAETGVEYALVVTTCAGLWRYVVGDTVTLIDRDPPRVLVTGRVGLTLSAFGEHVIVSELERAVAEAARAIAATVTDFAVGSLFSDRPGARGGHLYIVEFGEAGVDARRRARFAERLDAALCRLNEDYEAHRAGGFGLDAPRVTALAPGGFAEWMKRRGKLGGQNKAPRVIVDRALFDDLRAFAGAGGG